MHRTEVRWAVPGVALVLFLSCIAINWPMLPLNIRIPDLLFIPLVMLLGASARTAPRWSFTPFDLMVAIYIVGSVPSLFVTPDLAASMVELLRHVYVVTIYVTVAFAVRHGYLRAATTGMAASGALLAVIGVAFCLFYIFRPVDFPAIGQAMAMPYIGSSLRIQALTATPAMLACVLTMAVPFAITRAFQANGRRERVRWAIVIACMTVTVVMTLSHVFTGFLLAVLIAVWPRLRSRRLVRGSAVLVVAMAALLFNASVVASVRQVSWGDRGFSDDTKYFHALDQGHLEVGPIRVVYQSMSYFRLKELALEAFLERPWTGIGLDQFHRVSERAYGQGRLSEGYRIVDPHSALLGRMAETGLPGGLSLALLWIAMLVIGRRVLADSNVGIGVGRAAFAGLAGLLLAGVNVDIMNFRFFWAGLGVLRGLSEGGVGAGQNPVDSVRQ